MSTSILYHAFGIKGIRHKSTQYEKIGIIFYSEMRGRKFPCPKCKSRSSRFKGRKI